ncbi:collagen-like protein [Streptomyces sp. NPDC052114]|uniref:collagen-like protein n=1 Tax=unclassified Streptomyces TaxID=2593676 RepID=UPI003449A776
MTHLERVLARRWRSVFLVCVLLALSGVAVILWARIDAGDRRADRLAAEADRRGDAVSTLARDVRTLRAQVRSHGDTPAAPDPSEAIDDLLARVRAPAGLPGSRGADGSDGTNGSDGADGSDGSDGKPGAKGSRGEGGQQGEQGEQGEAGAPGEPGPTGAPGVNGQDGKDGRDGKDGAQGQAGPTGPAGSSGTNGDAGSTGPAGPAGPQGERGPKGEAGDPGPSCPDGYSLQQPAGDPDALVCRRTGGTPTAPAPALTLLAALPPHRRRQPHPPLVEPPG